MNSRERLLTAISGEKPDYVPLIFWCFGFPAPPGLGWQRADHDVPFWYTGRLEHIHTFPAPWAFHDDDFERVLAWKKLGVDDVLEVSVPWSVDPAVRVRDGRDAPSGVETYPVIWREYDTPAGTLRHAVRDTQEDVPPGWVIQPPHVALIEDFNIPRGVKHAIAGPEDLPKVRYLLCGPTAEQLADYRARMKQVRAFADREGVLVQGWSGFGMDLVAWLCGVEPAVLAAMTEPGFFQEIVDIVAGFDRMRTEILLDVGGVDVVAQRGWYSSIDFWSPRLFRRFLQPLVTELAAMAHGAGVKFAYTMTMGASVMADPLIAAQVDLLYYVDPVQDKTNLAQVKERFHGILESGGGRPERSRRVALAGGVNSAVTLGSGTPEQIRAAVHDAVRTLGPDGYILAPVDAIFPDTPWKSVAAMIAAWKEVR
jgi:uroporphyrinogen-III decarboxylase